MKPDTRIIQTAASHFDFARIGQERIDQNAAPTGRYNERVGFSPMPPSTKSLLRKAFKRGVAFARKRITA